MRNYKIATAVALALGGVSAAHAAAPSVAACQGTPNDLLYVAGSSAAQNAFANALGVDLFGGTANELIFSATNGNFEAFCGTSVGGATAGGIPTGDLVVIHYRGEGGSVVGALPIVSGKAIKFLNLADPSITGSTPNTANIVAVTTTGTSATNGTNDSWGGALTSHTVEVGVTDVEPGALVGQNYPTAYSQAAFGTATATQLGTISKVRLFDQVFGIAVNTQGLGATTIDLSRQSVANILTGTYFDFSSVPSGVNNGVVTTTSDPITVVNREAGSGTRTGTGIYFLGIGCGSPANAANAIAEDQSQDYYATGDVLKAANLIAGAVTYASIDNLPSSKYPNLVFASINGVAPTNTAAVSGEYDFWFEATMTKGTLVSSGSAGIYSYLTKELAAVASAPKVKDILAIPGIAGNAAAVPATAVGGIYVNPFTKSANSCSVPTETN